MTTRSQAEISAWLQEALGNLLEVDPASISKEAAFSEYGVSSMEAALIAGDLEDWLGRPVSAEDALTHGSIDRLAACLAAHADSSPGGIGEDAPV